ncbi:MAG TPA: hypothetical protein P5525_16510, partial [Candidatus Paceibacterota bacterium]|nr:hypothetical protein [Candidatus Paceibacterota bacterium]
MFRTRFLSMVLTGCLLGGISCTGGPADGARGATDLPREAGSAGEKQEPFRDLFSDTWVATDALGRAVPA